MHLRRNRLAHSAHFFDANRPVIILVGDSGENHVVVDDDLASSWLREAEKLPGWSAGHEFAPHPIAASALAEGEEDL